MIIERYLNYKSIKRNNFDWRNEADLVNPFLNIAQKIENHLNPETIVTEGCQVKRSTFR